MFLKKCSYRDCMKVYSIILMISKLFFKLKLSFKKVESRVEQKGHFFTVPGQLVTTTESIGEVSPSSARYVRLEHTVRRDC